MNVDFPGEGTAAAFWMIVGVILALGIGLLGGFLWKRWL